VYPDAGTVIAIGDGDYVGNWDVLLKGAVRGDIHLFRGWFPDAPNSLVKQLYREADFIQRSRASPSPVRSLTSGLVDKDPLVRWLAVARAKPVNHNVISAIARRLAAETDWVVRKKMIEVLGNSRDPAAVLALVPLAGDSRAQLIPFAASALGRLGRPAGPALARLAADDDPHVAESALVALAEVDEPKAVPLLLKLAENSPLSLRRAAIRALGGQSSPECTPKLVSLLKEKDRGVLIAACAALARQRRKPAVKPLVELIERSVTDLHDNDVRLAAGDALEAITGLEFGPYEQSWRAALDAGKL